MTTKRVALFTLIPLMVSQTSGMDYLRNWYNSASTAVSEKMPSAPSWAQTFINRCRTVGVFNTVAAMVGIYNFKSISGLDYNALDNYDSDTLKRAQNRVAQCIENLGHTQKLEDFFMLIQQKYHQAANQEELAVEAQELEL